MTDFIIDPPISIFPPGKAVDLIDSRVDELHYVHVHIRPQERISISYVKD